MSDSLNDTPVLDLLARMTADSLATTTLDTETLILVRIAALVAVDAAPVSYALNLEAAAAGGLDIDAVRGVLTAIAPIVGTARVASATGNIVKALAAEVALADLEVAELWDDDDYEDEVGDDDYEDEDGDDDYEDGDDDEGGDDDDQK